MGSRQVAAEMVLLVRELGGGSCEWDPEGMKQSQGNRRSNANGEDVAAALLPSCRTKPKRLEKEQVVSVLDCCFGASSCFENSPHHVPYDSNWGSTYDPDWTLKRRWYWA